MMDKVRLGDIFEYMPKSKIKAGEGKEQGKYKFFTSSNLQDKYIDKWIYDGEYLIFGTGGKASINYCNERFATSTDNFVVKVKKEINTKLIYLYFKNDMQKLEKGFKGASIKHISKDYINQLTIPIYDFKFQEKIVKQLDKVQEIINLRKKQIEELEELVKTQFVEMFGDIANPKFKCKKLKEIAKVGSSHRVFTTEFVEKGIPFYRGTEISQLANGIEPQNPYYISKEHYLKICDEDTKPKIGDLLMPSICDKGQIWLVDNEKEFYYKDGRVLSISPNSDKINNKYLHAYMKLKTIIEYPKMGSGSTFAEFKIFLLKDLDVIVPPLELQNRFAEIVKVIDKQKLIIKKSLKETEEMQSSFMNKYFL